MIEKEDMVRALCDAMEDRYVRGMNYSRTGMLVPGTVSDVDEDALMKELGWSEMDVVRGGRGVGTAAAADDIVTSPASSSSGQYPPLLLDVYATWCGPCQFMAPLLAKAAEEFGHDVRVVKLDSDKYPRISGALKGERGCVFFLSSPIFFFRSIFYSSCAPVHINSRRPLNPRTKNKNKTETTMTTTTPLYRN
jgi:thiol-disulfide isomerase/thioredoxin